MKNINSTSTPYQALRVLSIGLIAVVTSIGASASTDNLPSSSTELRHWKDASAAQLLELPAFRAEQRLQKQLADCMSKSGHDYQAYIPVSAFPGLFPTGETSVVNALNSSASRNVDDNPNQRHFASLSQNEQARYAETLWNRDTGCATLAYENTYTASEKLLGAPRVEAFEKALNSTGEQLENSAIYKKAVIEWSSCATAATGLDLQKPSDVSAYVIEDLNRSFQSKEGLVLDELLHAPASGSTKIDQGVLSAALDSARAMEADLNDSIQSCDQKLSGTIEKTHRKIVNQTFKQFDDVVKVLMND